MSSTESSSFVASIESGNTVEMIDVHESYDHGLVPHALDGLSLTVGYGELVRDHGSVGLREIDAALVARGARHAQLGDDAVGLGQVGDGNHGGRGV